MYRTMETEIKNLHNTTTPKRFMMEVMNRLHKIHKDPEALGTFSMY